MLIELKNKAEIDANLQCKIDDLLKLETIEIRDIRQILKEIGKRDQFLLLLLDDYHAILRKLSCCKDSDELLKHELLSRLVIL